MTVVKWCVSGARILDLLVENSLSGERNCGMIDLQTLAWWKQMEWKDTDDMRNEFCWEIDIYEPVKVFGSVIWRRLCVMEMILY